MNRRFLIAFLAVSLALGPVSVVPASAQTALVSGVPVEATMMRAGAAPAATTPTVQKVKAGSQSEKLLRDGVVLQAPAGRFDNTTAEKFYA